ncbi:6db613db-62c9-4e99-888c-c9372a6443fe [Thermothielavioides terrestris]|uniref:6db613db-62c9-4e99-888c-c9372a6443fe n=1 Tax=Thermothielavioides terrestris TaxID=2587410 RepID=A0A446BPH1_9PEZI|nr:6db613db-62c9-4e99-888c-c9372a6443fe [Thermothielavioides terrestris]
MARAACELDSVSRWAVTGTPIQNRISDLAAQLKFIRAYPYNDPKQFEADISRLWKSGEDEETAKRLKCLSACLLLRRAKATISLPARRDMTCPVDFSREERAAYDEAREQTITRIDEALHTDSEASRAGVYVNVLQQIESLRLICNLGLHYRTRRNLFSTWRLTLDVVEKGLESAGIRTIRFDGNVAQKERQSVVDRFKADPGIRVMLLTLSCGAVGLTLTVASRAYLMEPHWNPTLEEQALARIHRIGQTREVTTVRFYIRDSFEERVMELQNVKQQLARVLLSPHDGDQGDDSFGGLHKLRALL